jgi:hypothetical protein
MRSFAFSAAVGAALLAGLASSASAQTVISQWNLNNIGSGNSSFSAASSGIVTGSLAIARNFATMNAASAPFASVLVDGSPTDPGTVVTGTTYNRSFAVSSPTGTSANRSVGAAFTVSTASANPGTPIQLSWSQTVGFRGSRYFQVLVSTSGTAGPFTIPTGGTGSSISQLVNGLNSGTSAISGTATVDVSPTGLIDFRTINGNWLSQSVTTATSSILPQNYANGFVNNISYTLPTGQSYENNPNFAFAIVASWDPNIPGATSGTTGLVSSFSGLTLTDTTSGYINSVSSGGQMRLDLMTVSAVPEPTTYAMLGASALIGCSIAWRRRRESRFADSREG